MAIADYYKGSKKTTMQKEYGSKKSSKDLIGPSNKKKEKK